jgi:tripartite ATP-independent transporter DctM subunit
LESLVTVLGIGISYGIATLVAMFSGMPIAFALGAVALVFMAIFMPSASLDTVTQNVYEEMASITLLSIPLFILKGAAIGKSRAGQDLYSALHAWLHRVPGGLGVANVFACALFAAMAGSSPATCSAIGSAGIPEMRKRGYSGGFAAGIIAAGGTLGILLPPSITMILFAVAAEKSLGRLFLAGIGPGLLLVTLFGIYAVVRFRKEYATAKRAYEQTGTNSPILTDEKFTMAQRFGALPRVLPFIILLTGVMIALYGGYATPSETAGLGGLLALLLIALIYGVWRPSDLSPIMTSTVRESTMLMMIIGMSLLYSYVMSYLHISQSAAEAIVAMNLPRWELLAAILLLVVMLGFFLPPVSIILMTAPIILPPLRAAEFDIIWFGVVMTIVMEMGLIHPPVGLNIFVIRNVAPDIPLSDVIWGTLPFVLLMMLAVLLLCFVPGISTWLPDLVMGPESAR